MLTHFKPAISQFLLSLLATLFLAGCSLNSVPLLRPNGVAIAPDGSLLVMDRGNNRVVHLSSTGQLLHTFGQLGNGPQEIFSGWDIDLDSAGNIYICNITVDQVGSSRSRDEIKVFTPTRNIWRSIGEQVYSFEEDSNTPYGLDIDQQDRLYVADFDAGVIRVFSPQGQLLARFSGQSGDEAGHFNDPTDVAVDDPRGLLYVVDPFHSRVQQFNLTFTSLDEPILTHRLTFGGYGQAPGQLAYPQNITVDDASGRVYISDMGNRRIQVFDSEGRYVSHFALPGNWQVLGLDIGPDGAVYAADALNNVIWIFEPDGQVRDRVAITS
jgi:DNA-binding beta-propeller fold protein YncE